MNRAKHYIALFYSVCMVLLFLEIVWVSFRHGFSVARIVISVVVILLSFGLFKGYSIALETTGVLCVLVALFLPLAVFNPFAVGDYLAAGIEPPSFPGSLVWVVPLELILLASAYVLSQRFASANEQRKP